MSIAPRSIKVGNFQPKREPMLEEIIAWIDKQNDREVLGQIFNAAIMRRKYLAQVKTRAFSPGDKVVFTSARLGGELTGTVLSVGRINIKVKVDGGATWRVNAGLLRHR